jgi:hypothetical protein
MPSTAPSSSLPTYIQYDDGFIDAMPVPEGVVNATGACQGSLELSGNGSAILCRQYRSAMPFTFFSVWDDPAALATRAVLVGQEASSWQDTAVGCNNPSVLPDASSFATAKVLRVSLPEYVDGASAMLQKVSLSAAQKAAINMAAYRGAYLLQRGSTMGHSESATIFPATRDWREAADLNGTAPVATCSNSSVSFLESTCADSDGGYHFSSITHAFGWTVANVTEIFRCEYAQQQDDVGLLWMATAPSGEKTGGDGRTDWWSADSGYHPLLVLLFSDDMS